MENKDVKKYLDPNIISKLENMSVRARLVVEGFIIGLHKSPYHGFSVEFAEHRPYLPGDEIKYIDWKLFAKTDRFYIKEFEEETNLKSYLILDASRSMEFGSGRISKMDYASYLTASLAYLMLKQQDAVSLTVFDRELREYLPPRSSPAHLNQIHALLEKTEPGAETHIAPILHNLATKVKKRGLIILISDLLDDPEDILKGLKHFRHKRHEVIVFHILDPQERELDYTRQVRFVDLETRETILTEPWQIREKYRRTIDAFIEFMKKNCRENQIDYVLLTSDNHLDKALVEYLKKRYRIG